MLGRALIRVRAELTHLVSDENEICRYSKATRGNIEVAINLVLIAGDKAG